MFGPLGNYRLLLKHLYHCQVRLLLKLPYLLGLRWGRDYLAKNLLVIPQPRGVTNLKLKELENLVERARDRRRGMPMKDFERSIAIERYIERERVNRPFYFFLTGMFFKQIYYLLSVIYCFYSWTIFMIIYYYLPLYNII